MGTLPLDVKIGTLNEVGSALDDLLDLVKLDLNKAEGAHAAVTVVFNSVNKLNENIITELKAERITAEHAEIARLWISRAVQIIDNLLRNQANILFIARGAEAQNSKIVKAVKTMYDLECARKNRISSENPEDPVIVSDLAPDKIEKPVEPVVTSERKSPAPRTIKEQRLANQGAESSIAKRRGRRTKKVGA